MPLPVRPLLAAAVATAGLVVAGVVVLGGDHDEPEAPPAQAPFATTALADVDTTSMTFPRGPFCEEIDPRQVEAALGAAPVGSRSWQNGDPVPVTATKNDVGHEFGCEYAAADGTVARAWVFAPPVDAPRAAALSAATVPGWCTTSPAQMGTASTRLACLNQEGDRVAYRGLLGDAWLTCEVVLPSPADTDPPRDPPVDQAGRWCAGVLEAGS